MLTAWEWEAGRATGRGSGWGRGSPCPPLRAALLTPGDFCRQIPTTAAVSLLAMVGSARQNPRGRVAPLSLPYPAGSLCAGQGHQFPSWPRPGTSSISPGPWAGGGKQRDAPVPGRPQPQAEPSQVMLFPGFLLPIPQVPCPVLPAVPPQALQRREGGLGLELLAWPPQQPPSLLSCFPHPGPAASSPLARGSSKCRCSECTRASSLPNASPFFCTLLQSIFSGSFGVCKSSHAG